MNSKKYISYIVIASFALQTISPFVSSCHAQRYQTINAVIDNLEHIKSVKSVPAALTFKPEAGKTAAGILHYTEIEGQVHILLGERNTGGLCNLGGASDAEDAAISGFESLAHTAAREAKEESNDLYAPHASILQHLPFIDTITEKSSEQHLLHRMYWQKVGYIAPEVLLKAMNQATDHHSKEYQHFKWYKVEKLLKACQQSNPKLSETESIYDPLFKTLCTESGKAFLQHLQENNKITPFHKEIRQYKNRLYFAGDRDSKIKIKDHENSSIHWELNVENLDKGVNDRKELITKIDALTKESQHISFGQNASGEQVTTLEIAKRQFAEAVAAHASTLIELKEKFAKKEEQVTVPAQSTQPPKTPATPESFDPNSPDLWNRSIPESLTRFHLRMVLGPDYKDKADFENDQRKADIENLRVYLKRFNSTEYEQKYAEKAEFKREISFLDTDLQLLADVIEWESEQNWPVFYHASNAGQNNLTRVFTYLRKFFMLNPLEDQLALRGTDLYFANYDNIGEVSEKYGYSDYARGINSLVMCANYVLTAGRQTTQTTSNSIEYLLNDHSVESQDIYFRYLEAMTLSGFVDPQFSPFHSLFQQYLTYLGQEMGNSVLFSLSINPKVLRQYSYSAHGGGSPYEMMIDEESVFQQQKTSSTLYTLHRLIKEQNRLSSLAEPESFEINTCKKQSLIPEFRLCLHPDLLFNPENFKAKSFSRFQNAEKEKLFHQAMTRTTTAVIADWLQQESHIMPGHFVQYPEIKKLYEIMHKGITGEEVNPKDSESQLTASTFQIASELVDVIGYAHIMEVVTALQNLAGDEEQKAKIAKITKEFITDKMQARDVIDIFRLVQNLIGVPNPQSKCIEFTKQLLNNSMSVWDIKIIAKAVQKLLTTTADVTKIINLTKKSLHDNMNGSSIIYLMDRIQKLGDNKKHIVEIYAKLISKTAGYEQIKEIFDALEQLPDGYIKHLQTITESLPRNCCGGLKFIEALSKIDSKNIEVFSNFLGLLIKNSEDIDSLFYFIKLTEIPYEHLEKIAEVYKAYDSYKKDGNDKIYLYNLVQFIESFEIKALPEMTKEDFKSYFDIMQNLSNESITFQDYLRGLTKIGEISSKDRTIIAALIKQYFPEGISAYDVTQTFDVFTSSGIGIERHCRIAQNFLESRSEQLYIWDLQKILKSIMEFKEQDEQFWQMAGRLSSKVILHYVPKLLQAFKNIMPKNRAICFKIATQYGGTDGRLLSLLKVMAASTHNDPERFFAAIEKINSLIKSTSNYSYLQEIQEIIEYMNKINPEDPTEFTEVFLGSFNKDNDPGWNIKYALKKLANTDRNHLQKYFKPATLLVISAKQERSITNFITKLAEFNPKDPMTLCAATQQLVTAQSPEAEILAILTALSDITTDELIPVSNAVKTFIDTDSYGIATAELIKLLKQLNPPNLVKFCQEILSLVPESYQVNSVLQELQEVNYGDIAAFCKKIKKLLPDSYGSYDLKAILSLIKAINPKDPNKTFEAIMLLLGKQTYSYNTRQICKHLKDFQPSDISIFCQIVSKLATPQIDALSILSNLAAIKPKNPELFIQVIQAWGIKLSKKEFYSIQNLKERNKNELQKLKEIGDLFSFKKSHDDRNKDCFFLELTKLDSNSWIEISKQTALLCDTQNLPAINTLLKSLTRVKNRAEFCRILKTFKDKVNGNYLMSNIVETAQSISLERLEDYLKIAAALAPSKDPGLHDNLLNVIKDLSIEQAEIYSQAVRPLISNSMTNYNVADLVRCLKEAQPSDPIAVCNKIKELMPDDSGKIYDIYDLQTIIPALSKVKSKDLDAVCKAVMALRDPSWSGYQIRDLINGVREIDLEALDTYVAIVKKLLPKAKSGADISEVLKLIKAMGFEKIKNLKEATQILIDASDADSGDIPKIYQLVDSIDAAKRVGFCKALTVLVKDFRYDFFKACELIVAINPKNPQAFCASIHQLRYGQRLKCLEMIRNSATDDPQELCDALMELILRYNDRKVLEVLEDIAPENFAAVCQHVRNLIVASGGRKVKTKERIEILKGVLGIHTANIESLFHGVL
ncbi:MAG: hypothetical protein ABFQ95_05705 [Pseudomonadota bacterium]